MAGNHHHRFIRRQLHHFAGREQRPRGLLARHHQVPKPGCQPVAGIVALRTQLGGRAQRFRNALGRALVVRCERDAHMAVVQDRMVLAIGLVDLVQRLRDQEGSQTVARHESQRRLEEIQPPEGGELVEHQKQLVPTRHAVRAVERFGQAPADLVEDQPDQRLGAADVRRRNHQVQRHRRIRRDQVGDAPVAARCDLGDGRIAIQPKEAHRGGQHTGSLVVALVEHFPRRRCDDRMDLLPKMTRSHHPLQRDLEGTGGIRQEVGDATQRLVFCSVEHVQNGTDQQRMAGLLPVVAPLERALGINQNVGDVLHVADFMRAAPDFEQRVVRRRPGVGRVEQQTVREARAPTRGQRPVLALDVVDDGRAEPGQQRGHHEADTLARPRRRESHHVLRARMAQIVAVLARRPSEEDAFGLRQPGVIDLFMRGPARRAVGRDTSRRPRAPDGRRDGGARGEQTARRRDRPATQKDARRIGIEEVPPLEQLPRLVDRNARDAEPWRSEPRLVAQCSSSPLRGRPDAAQCDAEHHDDLSKQDAGRHWPPPSQLQPACHSGSALQVWNRGGAVHTHAGVPRRTLARVSARWTAPRPLMRHRRVKGL